MSSSKSLDLTGCINVPHLWKGILDSYHNYYDVFSELIQNSVDSVRKSGKKNPTINVFYDGDNQIIEVYDNGIGLSEDDLSFFALGNTNKSDEEESIGEKGLGASFILGISDDFYIETVKDNKKIVATCKKAYSTIKDKKVPVLDYTIEDFESESYCKIRVQIEDVDIDIDSFEKFKFILRTRTAIGNTSNLFLEPEKKEKIDITVKLILEEKEFQEQIPFVYLHLDELAEGLFPVFDAEFIKRSNKWMVDETEIGKRPRGILRLIDYEKRIYLTFAEVGIYEKLGSSIGNGRFPDDIVVAIKGCPTSVEVNKPRLGNAGYYTNLHIVIEGNDFTLDAGRKTITRENADQVREKIRSFFSDIVKLSKLFVGTPHDAIGEGAGLDQVKERARNTQDLKIDGIQFGKVPRHEQSVVAIFHELLGAKILEGYKSLLVSQYNTFDILFEYQTSIEKIGKNPREIYLKSAGRGAKDFKMISFGEFKLLLSKFCDDVNNDIKAMDHVNLVIVWETGTIPTGWDFRKIYPDEVVYQGANYVLTKVGYKKIHVILLIDFHDKNNGNGN